MEVPAAIPATRNHWARLPSRRRGLLETHLHCRLSFPRADCRRIPLALARLRGRLRRRAGDEIPRSFSKMNARIDAGQCQNQYTPMPKSNAYDNYHLKHKSGVTRYVP